MRESLITRLCFLLIFITSLAFVSCDTTKKIKYFQDIPDSGQVKTIPKAVYVPLKIQVGDILNVGVQVDDPMSSTGAINSANAVSGGATSAASNSGGGGGATAILAALSGGGVAAQQPLAGFQVDSLGDLEIPVLGKVSAAGQTTYELSQKLKAVAVKYYKNPIVIVKFANFKVNVTGEVLKPGQYVMPDEKESVMDAIAMAGDLTVFGKRENVLLIRQNTDGTQTAYRLNLKKSQVLSSPLYYLRQNDIIYVEPRKAKSDATDASQVKFYTLGAAVLSVLIILATRTHN